MHPRDLLMALAAGVAPLAPVCAGAMGAADPFTAPRASASASASASAVELRADPTPTDGLTGLRLRSQPMAFIDGRWWRIGGTVRGARLSAIHADSIELRHADGRIDRLPWNPMHSAEAAVPTPAPTVARNATP